MRSIFAILAAHTTTNGSPGKFPGCRCQDFAWQISRTKPKQKFNIAGAVLLLCLLLAAFPGDAVIGSDLAVDNGTARLTPAASQIETSATITIDLAVTAVSDINAYDVEITYNPAVAVIESWSHGGFLSNLAQVYKVEEPGKLRLVFAQLATPAVSGDGVLLRLVFRGVEVGTTDIRISRLDFSNASGTLTSPAFENANLQVIPAAPTAAPSPTQPTSTPVPATATQPLPTSAPTFSPTATRSQPTAIPTLQPVQGTATLAGTAGVNLGTLDALSRVTLIPSRTPTLQWSQPTPISMNAGTAVSGEVYLPGVQSDAAPKDSLVTGNPSSDLNLILWGLLGILMLIFAGMGIVFIRRAKNKTSDKDKI